MTDDVDSPPVRKARGAFFTPPPICDFITRWAVRAPSDRILEPSCGDAGFLLSAGRVLTGLGCGGGQTALTGVEIHAPSATEARSRVASAGFSADIVVSDFFDYEPQAQFDAVVGNPPFIRYQGFSGAAREKAKSAARAQGVDLSNMASSWAPFVIHSAGTLKAEGRLGMVLPGEILTSNYARDVRAYLVERFASIRLVMFRNLVFNGVAEEVVLLLAEGAGPARRVQMVELTGAEQLASIPESRWIDVDVSNGGNWLTALVDKGALEALKDLGGRGLFEPLSEWGRPTLGMVTGNNAFFTMTEAKRATLGIPLDAVQRISPPGSRHFRKTLSLDSGEWEALRDAGMNVYLFRPADRASSQAVRRYIATGEEQRVDQAFKCRSRDPWWRVPWVRVPDLFLTYMNHDAPRLVCNSSRVGYLNSVLGIEILKGRKRIGKSLLPAAALNSATLLSAEIVGRSYGGGILKIEPKAGRGWLMPSRSLVEQARERLTRQLPEISRHLAAGDVDRVVSLVDGALFDNVSTVDEEKLDLLRTARTILRDRRVSRSQTPSSAS